MTRLYALVVLLAACSTAQPKPVVAPADEVKAPAPVGLMLFIEPKDAEIRINGKSYGKVGSLAPGGFLPLEPGNYRVSVQRAGFESWRAEVSVTDKAETFRVMLLPKP